MGGELCGGCRCRDGSAQCCQEETLRGLKKGWKVGRCVRPVFRSRKTGVFYLSVLFHFPFSFAFAVQFPVTTDIELLTL